MQIALHFVNSKLVSDALGKRKSKNQGFSLIELVVVIAVLAILIAIALPNFLGVQRDAKISSAKNTLTNIIKECAVKESRGNPPSFGGGNPPAAGTIQTAFTDLNGYSISRSASIPTTGAYAVAAANPNGPTGIPANVTAGDPTSTCYLAVAAPDAASGLGRFSIYYDAASGQLIKRCTIAANEYPEGCFTTNALNATVAAGHLNTQGFW